MKKIPTITTTSSHGMAKGDLVTVIIPDPRWWKRLWCFLRGLEPPMIYQTRTVGEVKKHIFTITKDKIFKA